MRPMSFTLGSFRRFGDVWALRVPTQPAGFVITGHPDHLRSLLTSDPGDAPSLTGESPLRPILGPNSILTSTGARHLRQRRLLLPPFHGEAVARYVEAIVEVADREIDRWPVGEPFALAPRMQAVTLEVIMRGVFGIEGETAPGTIEHRMRQTIRRLLGASTSPLFTLVEMRNAGRREPRDLLALMLKIVDRQMYAVIAQRRAGSGGRGDDVLSLLLAARDDEGSPLSDRELRDELMSLVLAGHETTANALAWTVERLLHTPAAYDRLRSAVRDRGGTAEEGAPARAYVEATIHEGMRSRPVIPMIVRRVTRPWRFGEYVVPAGTPVAVSIIGIHHRSDVYPEPHRFAPERFLDDGGADGAGRDDRAVGGDIRAARFHKPGTYTWIPFGGGIRRCLGATLAMAEQRVVLEAIARRTDLALAGPVTAAGPGESPRMRNVTMIPRHGVPVTVTHRRPG